MTVLERTQIHLFAGVSAVAAAVYYGDCCISAHKKRFENYKKKKTSTDFYLYLYFRWKQMNISRIHFSYLNFLL